MERCAVLNCDDRATARYVMVIGGAEIEANVCEFHDVLIRADDDVNYLSVEEN